MRLLKFEVMKKTILAIGVLMALCTHSFAQDKSSNNNFKKGFYLKAAGGYFMSVSSGQFPNVGPYPPEEVYQTYDPSTATYTNVSTKVLTGSYGAGIQAGLSGGYAFNKFISAELTLNYFHSKSNLMTHQVTTISSGPLMGQQAGNIISNGHVNALALSPSIVITPGFESKFNPYIRFGVVVPVWGRLYISSDIYKLTPNLGSPYPATAVAQTTVHREEEIRPNITIGFVSALGGTYKISKCLDIFAEIEYRNVPVESKNKEVTVYNEVTNIIDLANGTTLGSSKKGLSDLSTAEINTNYQTTLTQNSNTPIDNSNPLHPKYKNNNAPSDDLKSYINIGGLGLNVGVKFRL